MTCYSQNFQNIKKTMTCYATNWKISKNNDMLLNKLQKIKKQWHVMHQTEKYQKTMTCHTKLQNNKKTITCYAATAKY